MMKIQRVTACLAGLALLSSAFASACCLWFVLSSRQNLAVQRDVMKINNFKTAMHSLLLDSIEYSKRNPSMVPLLQSWNVLPPGASNPASATSGTRAPSR
jgi:hypothetical protein